MKIFKRQLFYYIGIAAAVLILASCGKEPQPEDNKNNGKPETEKPEPEKPEPEKPKPEKPDEGTVINGTRIEDGNNLIGLISDSETGKGIAGVPVTDGYTFTSTDENGVYQFKAHPNGRKVYYTTPAAYKINVSNDNLPEFFSKKWIDNGIVNRNDFKLTPLPAAEDKFTLIMIGDPQCKTEDNAMRYKSETLADLKKTINEGKANGYVENAVYAMTLGDITFDKTALWPTMKNSMSNIRLADGTYLTFFNCIGNHDHDAAESNDFDATMNFFRNFGPADYSFDRGNAHIIVMDNIVCTKTNGSSWTYEAGLTAEQINWLKADLSYVQNKAGKVVFFCAHIPFRGGANSGGSSMNRNKNYAEVLNLLQEFNEAHIMIGHTHYSQNYVHTNRKCMGGLPIYEHIHASACGSWWTANCSSDVIGGPSGYNVYTVEGNTVTDWYNKGTGRDKDFQLRVYDGNAEYTGKKGYIYRWDTTVNGGKGALNVGGSANIFSKGNANYKGAFVAQVWDDDDTYWTVELYQNGAKVGDFTRIANGGSTNVHYTAYSFNEQGKNTTTWASTTASHYWYYKPASGKPAEEKDWEVRATQIIPGSGKTKVYTCSSITTSFDTYK